jgi:long-chain fatty acid transport protein
MRKILFLLLLIPSTARAGGFEIYEQSPAGVGTAGAQTAVVDDSAAIYYNPAKMAYIRGWSGMVSVQTVNSITKITAPAGQGANAESNEWNGIPSLYGVQRIGSRFAIGLGGFTNMSENFDYQTSNNFAGRFLGTYIKLVTLTIQPTVAFRPLPWLSLGVGLDIVPSSIDLKQAVNFGSAEGGVHTSGTATGVGGNLGLYIRAVPRWLDLAFTYRSAVDLDFEGKAAVTVPPELSMMASSMQNMKTNITLPHNFTFAVGSHLAPHLSVDFDAHLVLWDVVKSLTLTLTDPNAPPGTPATVQGQDLSFRMSYGLRLGFELRFADEKVRLRVGGGYERTPVPRASLRPLSADADRGLFGIGIGYHAEFIGVDISYLLAFLPTRVSADPTYPATYDSIGHIISVGAALHFDTFGGRINEPDFKH